MVGYSYKNKEEILEENARLKSRVAELTKISMKYIAVLEALADIMASDNPEDWGRAGEVFKEVPENPCSFKYWIEGWNS